MALPVLTAAALALLATPAGQIAIRKGSKAVARLLKRNKPTRGSVLLAGSGAAELSNEEGPIDMKAKGGLIKSRIDGIAAKGKTRAKHR
jgi:hypothetical protein